MKFPLLIKTKMLNYWERKKYLPLKLSDVVFILLINANRSTKVGILAFINTLNFMLSWFEHEKWPGARSIYEPVHKILGWYISGPFCPILLTRISIIRVIDSRPRGRGFEPHRRHCVVSLSKNINPSLVLVQSRKTRPFITERLLMGRKESNQTNKTNNTCDWCLRWLKTCWNRC